MPQAADKRGVVDVENAMRFDPGGGQEQRRRLIGALAGGGVAAHEREHEIVQHFALIQPQAANRRLLRAPGAFRQGKIHRKGTLAFQGGNQILTHQPGENVVADKERYVFHTSAFFALKIELLNTILLISRVMDSIAEV